MLMKNISSEQKLHYLYMTLSFERHDAVHTAKIAMKNCDYPSYFDACRKYREFNDIINEYFEVDDEYEAFPSYTMQECFDELRAMYASVHEPVVFSDGSLVVNDVDIPF